MEKTTWDLDVDGEILKCILVKDGVIWTHPAQDRAQLRALVNTTRKLRVP